MIKQQVKKLRCWPLIACLTLVVSQPLFAISAQEAAALVSSQVTGRVLDVKSSQEQGRAIFIIKVLTEDSRVIMVRVDQTTGQLLH